MKKVNLVIFLFLVSLLSNSPFAQDPIADNMLFYQRNIGGWPKHIGNIKVDYTKPLSQKEKAVLLKDKQRSDATIDNGATTKEIRHLLKAYKTTGTRSYLTAAEKGVSYLLTMQMGNGGFPQFYPDSSSYRGQITYNDNAMINALNVLWDVAQRSADFDVLNPSFKEAATKAIEKGIDCILKTQIRVNGKLTGWCAQHDKNTLRPVKARSYELVSISGMESDDIVEFLIKVENPSPRIRAAVSNAVQWFEGSKIKGYRYTDIDDKSQPKGKDRILVKDSASVVWARFYDIETGRPFFSGRDGEKKWNLSEIEVERRVGYAWYGTWPKNLVSKLYPRWVHKYGVATVKDIRVAQDGSGDFFSIQEAINSLPDSSATPRTILIKPGRYYEKIFISKHNIILEGEDRETTKIVQSTARDEWRCYQQHDWGVATMNLDGDDLTLRNLTIANEYGFTQTAPRTIACASDSTGRKVITKGGHQMALRTFGTTRLKAVNCRFSAWAGDTVSPWNLTDGMFYFKDCIMEGGVDFYCPRGWAWAENCTFYTNTGDAAIWHDGSGKEDFKTVLKNCRFDGYEGFKLGRYHRDAQFYLVGSTFSKNMADKDIYQVATANTLQWPRRVYYAGCKREGGNYAWFKDNLKGASGSPAVKDITVDWLFKGAWRPHED